MMTEMEGNQPHVSVGMPVYKGDRFLKAALDSIWHRLYPRGLSAYTVKDERTAIITRMNKILEYMALGKLILQVDLLEGKHSAARASIYARPSDAVNFLRKFWNSGAT